MVEDSNVTCMAKISCELNRQSNRCEQIKNPYLPTSASDPHVHLSTTTPPTDCFDSAEIEEGEVDLDNTVQTETPCNSFGQTLMRQASTFGEGQKYSSAEILKKPNSAATMDDISDGEIVSDAEDTDCHTSVAGHAISPGKCHSPSIASCSLQISSSFPGQDAFEANQVISGPDINCKTEKGVLESAREVDPADKSNSSEGYDFICPRNEHSTKQENPVEHTETPERDDLSRKVERDKHREPWLLQRPPYPDPCDLGLVLHKGNAAYPYLGVIEARRNDSLSPRVKDDVSKMEDANDAVVVEPEKACERDNRLSSQDVEVLKGSLVNARDNFIAESEKVGSKYRACRTEIPTERSCTSHLNRNGEIVSSANGSSDSVQATNLRNSSSSLHVEGIMDMPNIKRIATGEDEIEVACDLKDAQVSVTPRRESEKSAIVKNEAAKESGPAVSVDHCEGQDVSCERHLERPLNAVAVPLDDGCQMPADRDCFKIVPDAEACDASAEQATISIPKEIIESSYLHDRVEHSREKPVDGVCDDVSAVEQGSQSVPAEHDSANYNADQSLQVAKEESKDCPRDNNFVFNPSRAVQRALTCLTMRSTGAHVPGICKEKEPVSLNSVAADKPATDFGESDENSGACTVRDRDSDLSRTSEVVMMLRAIESAVARERERRKESSPPRCNRVVFVVLAPSMIDDSHHAKQIARLLTQNSSLSVRILEHSDVVDRQSWKCQLARRDIVLIVSAQDLLSASRANFVSLVRCHLALYIGAECALVAKDPFRILLRESYRTLPESFRPRIFALTTVPIRNPVKRVALEQILGIEFYAGMAGGDIVFRERILPVARCRSAPLADVENLFYPTEDQADTTAFEGDRTREQNGFFQHLQPVRRHQPSLTSVSARSGRLSNQLSVITEVGLIGLALYQRRVNLQRLRQKWRREFKRVAVPEETSQSLHDIADCFYPLECQCARDMMTGLSRKAISLLNLLQSWYSVCRFPDTGDTITEIHKLNVIVYAGKPAVAAALCEVIRIFPGFTGVTARVVIGDNRAAKSFDRHDDGNDDGWQGGDTDDEGISDFATGVANILVVASDNLGQITRSRRPLPPCPLVIRFDGSSINPDVDGGGGRCRVVTFLPDSLLRRARNGGSNKAIDTMSNKNIDANTAIGMRERGAVSNTGAQFCGQPPSKNLESARADVGELKTLLHERPVRPRSSCNDGVEAELGYISHEENALRRKTHIDTLSTHKLPVRPCLPENNLPANWTVSPNVDRGLQYEKSGEMPRTVIPYDEFEADGSSFTFPVRPAFALHGPSEDGGETCFLYSIITQIRKGDDWVDVDHAKTGAHVRSFLLALTARLPERDLIIDTLETGGEASMGGANSSSRLRLDLVDTLVLTGEEVALGREYTASVFSTIMRRCDVQMFQWGSRAVAEGNMTRRYLVLPSGRLQGSAMNDNEETPPPLDSRAVLFRYFGSEYLTSEVERFRLEDVRDSDLLSRDEEDSGRYTIDWDAVHSVIDFMEDAQNADRHVQVVPKENECPSDIDPYSYLEGKITYAAYCGRRRPYMTGYLEHRLSPLSEFVRQKRFALDGDGNLADRQRALEILLPGCVDIPGEADLSLDRCSNSSNCVQQTPSAGDNAVNLEKRKRSEKDFEAKETTVEASRPRTSKIEASGGNSVDSTELPSTKRPKLADSIRENNCSKDRVDGGSSMAGTEQQNVVGDMKQGVLDPVSKPRQIFSSFRNRKRRRTSWYGPVKESYYAYFESSRKFSATRLDQPMMPVCIPEALSVHDMLRVASGASLPSIVSEVHDANTEQFPENKIYMLPEVLRVHPIPVSGLFLPSVLMTVERHITTCSLRDIFIDDLGTSVDIPSLLQAVTSSAVNSSSNYERLELLGDAVLKLAATIRLFVCYPHKAEGDLHVLRCAIVCNNMLQAKAQNVGIHHFLNFSRDAVTDWTPPGWDRDARPQPIYDKALADVVEAITGVCYLRGVAEYSSASNEDCARGTFGDQHNSTNSVCLDGHVTTKSIMRGYAVGSKFLEIVGVLDGAEPSHKSILLSAIHAMHPPGTRAPKDARPSSFPVDKRLTNPHVTWEMHLGIVENRIGYRFKRRQLLLCALTHGSYAESLGPDGMPLLSSSESFQRLEFLGDAAIDFCVSCYLFDRYPNQGPGELTELKSAVVSNEAFARVSVQLELHKFLYCKSGALRKEIELFVQSVVDEDRNKMEGCNVDDQMWLREREAPKVLGDIFEGIAGAILVDSGMEMVWNVYMKLLGETLRERADPACFAAHPVKMLHDFVTKKEKLCRAGPQYVVPDVGGRGLLVRADVYVHKLKVGTGEGSTKKRAMCLAAKHAHERLSNCKAGSADAELLEKLRMRGDKERAVLAQTRRRRHDSDGLAVV